MKKVAHICTSSISHKILADKLTILKQKGYDVHLVSSPDGYEAAYMQPYDIKLHFLSMNRKIHVIDDIRSILQMRKLFLSEHFDIVHTHTAKAGLIGRIAAWLAKTPIILHTSHGLPFFDGQKKLQNFIYRSLEKFGALFSDALSSQNREDIAKLQQIAPEKPVYYEGNGVDLHRLDAVQANISDLDLDQLRIQANIPAGKRIMLMAARLEPVKDHAFLLASLHKLKTNFIHDFVCLIAGKGPLEADLLHQIKELGLEDEVRMIGHQAHIYPWIQLADLVVLTSEKEGIPRFLMEAMAFGKPAVASDVLGTRELVKHEESGLLVPYRHVDGLALALNEMMKSDCLLQQFGEGARREIEMAYTEHAVVERLHHMYVEIEQRKLTKKRLVQGVKRLLDCLLGSTAAIFLSPVYVVIAILVRTRLGSPVIFKQQRPGMNGHPFYVYKFRTMTSKRNEYGELLPDEERLTTFGKLLRKTSLDELPQLFNVISGKMSLIGPRPLLMEYLHLYTEEQKKRHWVRPGITGWAQVNGRNAISWEAKFKLDVWYTENHSLLLDAKILWMTVKKVFHAEGVQQAGHVTTSKFTGNQQMEGF